MVQMIGVMIKNHSDARMVCGTSLKSAFVPVNGMIEMFDILKVLFNNLSFMTVGVGGKDRRGEREIL